MNRVITTRDPVFLQEKKNLTVAKNGKLVITEYNNQKVTLLIRGNRLLAAKVWEKKVSQVGAIYLGKIKKVVKNIESYFVEIANKELCYLSFSDAKFPFLINRQYDGRLLEGDELLVQVSRDALKTKQASLTTKLSIAGKFIVLVIGTKQINLSTKLSPKRKESILEFLQQNNVLNQNRLLQEEKHTEDWIPDYGIIIRTEAENIPDDHELLLEYIKMKEQLFHLFQTARHRTCFSCLLEPESSLQTSMKIASTREYAEIITDSEEIYQEVVDYVSKELGYTDIPVRLYKDENYSLQKLYSIRTKLQEALNSRVWLKSGGYLIIEPTEALTVIDVNSGKISSSKDIEETFWKINSEAAQEIAYQLRLRNLSGIIIIDFINMKKKQHQKDLLLYLKRLVQQDILTTTVVDMTPLGLVELTRKKKYKTLKEQITEME